MSADVSIHAVAAVSNNIVIKTKARVLDLYVNGKLYKTYPVAVGKFLTPTPKGSFRIINKSRNPGGPYGARWIGLSKPHIGIHGTNNPASIGKAVSNGCIRMHNKDIEELFGLVRIGAPVKII
jgi:L,D-transpeptidase ErfK/SrfK